MADKDAPKVRLYQRIFGILLLLTLPIALACGGVGIRKWRLASRTSMPIHELTAAELIASGPGNNAYVRITQATPLLQSFVVRRDFPGQSSWREAYIPLAPAGVNEDLEGSPRIILITTSLTNKDQLAKLDRVGSYEGVVVSGVDSLKKNTVDRLTEGYPLMDLSQCYLIDHNALPPSKQGAMISWGIGLVSLVAFLLLATTTRRWMPKLPPRRARQAASVASSPPPSAQS